MTAFGVGGIASSSALAKASTNRSSWFSSSFLKAIDNADSGLKGPAAIIDFQRGLQALTTVASGSIAAATTAQLIAINADTYANALTFTRSSTATYIDVNGVMQTAAVDEPRFDYTNGVRQQLVEGASTNLLSLSNAISTWAPQNSNAVGNQSGGVNGGNSFSLWTRLSTASSFISSSEPKAAVATQYTYSAYVKAGTGRYCALRLQGIYPNMANVVFDLQTGTISTSASITGTFTAPSASISPVYGFPGVYRVTLTATSDTATTFTVFVSFNSNNVVIDGTDSSPSSSGYFQFAQLEALPFASSYIPTSGSAVTRAGDSVLFSAKLLALINRQGTTIVLKGRALGLKPVGAFIGSNNGEIIRQGVGNPTQILAGNQNVPALTALASPVGINPFPFGFGYSYSSTFRGISANGSAITTDANTNALGYPAASLGSAAGGTAGYFLADQLIIYPFRATDAEVQRLAAAYV